MKLCKYREYQYDDCDDDDSIVVVVRFSSFADVFFQASAFLSTLTSIENATTTTTTSQE
jgi:hypothetical protein